MSSMEERVKEFANEKSKEWIKEPFNPTKPSKGGIELMAEFAEKESLDRAIEELLRCGDEFMKLVKGNDAVDKTLKACSAFIDRRIAELKAAQKGEVKK